MLKAAAVLALFLVAGCGTISAVRATRADATGVTFEFPVGRQDEATHQAMLYCANLGRGAVLKSTKPEGSDAAVAVYDCR